MKEISLLYITHPSEDHAKKISAILLDNKLIACANLFPVSSTYFWQGQLENENEWVSLIKTIPGLVDKIEHLVKEHHSYDVPCILKWNATANDDYYQWIVSECSIEKQ
jgi:periplasmic divalent cation tolerance protein